MNPLMTVFALVGVVVVGFLLADLLWDIFIAIRAHLLPRCTTPDPDFVSKFGPWAVVTGCTDGIGKAYAMELAKRHVNLVLISRNPEKLAALSSNIETRFHVKTKVIPVDFSKGQSVFYNIETELKGVPVGILVNNVGKQYTYPMYLGEVPEQELWDIININVGATTMMTRILMPQMLARNRGAIVNVSSSSELQPLPLMTVYAATKAFVRSFSKALQVEYQKDGIIVQHLSPFFINTKMNAFSHRLQTNSLFVPNAQIYAENAINTLGQVNHSTGYWAHGIQYFFTTIPPTWIRTYIGAFMNQIFRKDYLHKNKSNV
ncbi:inactive hydroxysteroid dehydrogenase-like protein 1 [Cimex lectularius]|uniref:Inactive hydroxysteroid dehydrogenase-like protein 1 n=1 Tax=Cimex lectularius TaxID=79782 RepID=A0A8I6S742_CIMLE|nr:inactive hydroxysteroid dehydrogenase-like protein 1 [Cimex lectularius]